MYKFIIKNTQGEIVLTSSKSFNTVSEALNRGKHVLENEDFYGFVDIISV